MGGAAVAAEPWAGAHRPSCQARSSHGDTWPGAVTSLPVCKARVAPEEPEHFQGRPPADIPRAGRITEGQTGLALRCAGPRSTADFL